MEAADESTHPQDLRAIVEKFRAGLTQESAWNSVRHLFVPNADRHEMLEAIAHCHIASFAAGNEYLSARLGQARIDGSIRCLLGKLTSEARDAMLKDFPVLMRAPELTEKTPLQSANFPPLVLTLSEAGLRLPLDQRHAGDERGDGGLRRHEAEQLLARVQSERPERGEIGSAGMHTARVRNNLDIDTDHWLAERLRKFEPHFSARRATLLSLNDVAHIDENSIVCRHIAALWEEDFLRTGGKPTYQTLNSPAALQQAARSVMRSDVINRASVVGERANGAQYWMSNDWGQVLAENFKAMSRQAPGSGPVCRTLYLVTPNHAMVLGLKIKDRAGARRYVVQFYDPNKTVTHQRSAITATRGQGTVPAEIAILKPHDFLSETIQKHYFLLDAANRPIPALFFGEKLEPGVPRFAGDFPDLDEQVMYSMLYNNLADQLHAYADKLKSNDDITRLKTCEPSLSPEQLVVLLSAKGSSGNPGLYFALQNGHAETVEALGELLKACQPPLSPAQLTVLLSAKSRTGAPGLYVALQNGHHETVEAFGKLLKTCEPPLSPEQLMVLLSAKNSTGSVGLYTALQEGHAETVAAFGKLLKTCDPPLSSEQLMVLLSAKSGDSVPGLYDALQDGHHETVEVFGELLKACRPALSADQILELLSAKDPDDGMPGLYAALCHAHANTIVAFGKALTTCQPSLSPEQLTDLLSAKDNAGTPGLYFALENGHTATIEAFAEVLKASASSLTQEQFLDLLLIRLPDGYPALCDALQAQDAKWIEAYGKLLGKLGASLPTRQLAEILGAEIDRGQSALQNTSKSGHGEAAAAFEALRVKFVPHA